jgi:hypothetical protein
MVVATAFLSDVQFGIDPGRRQYDRVIGESVCVRKAAHKIGSTLSDLLVSKINLQIIVLNIVFARFLIAALHHSLL